MNRIIEKNKLEMIASDLCNTEIHYSLDAITHQLLTNGLTSNIVFETKIGIRIFL